MTLAELIERERAHVSRWLALRVAALAAAAGAFALAAGTSTLGHGRWLRAPATLPLIAWAIVGALAVATVIGGTLRLRRETGRQRIATAIEREGGLRRGTVRGAMEVATRGPLGRHGARTLADRLASLGPLVPRLRQRAARRTGAALAAAVLAVATLGAASTTAPDGWLALRHPVRAWRGTLLSPLRLQAPAEVPRGQSARVRVRAAGRRRVALTQRVTGAAWSRAWYPVVGDSAVVATVPVDGDLTLVATDGRTQSDPLLIRASDRPYVGGIALRATYPPYLHRASEALVATAPVRVPRGTLIAIVGQASRPLTAVRLAHDGGGMPNALSLAAGGTGFTGRISAESGAAGRWTWSAATATGPVADLPAPLDLDVVADSAPMIVIVSPAQDTIVGATDRVALSLRATDDHGVADVVVRSWRVHGPRRGTLAELDQHVLAGPPTPQWSGTIPLDLALRGVAPGDALHVVAEATDDSPWRQRATTRELVLHIPSLSDQRILARAAAESTVARASAMVAAERQLMQQTEEAASARGLQSGSPSGQAGAAGASTPRPSPPRPLPYDMAQRAKALGSEQQALDARVDSLRQQAQRLGQTLQQAGALDSGLAARLAQAQQLLHDALTPALARQLDQLNQAATSLDAAGTRQAMGDLAQQQRALREQLDRTVDILRRAALEGAMQTAHDEARDLANAERAQAQQQAAPTAANEASAADMADRSRALSQEIQQLAARLSDAQAATGAAQVAAARAPVDSSAQAMAHRNPGSAAGTMDRAAQDLASARQAQVDAWKSALSDDLDRSVQETMQLAAQEQSLAQAAQRGTTDRGDLAAQQSAVEQGVERTTERLQRDARQSALISQSSQQAVGEAGTRVQQATGAARATQPGGAGPGEMASEMRAASDALTAAAGSLARDRARTGSASSASGLGELLQQMQHLAEQQGRLSAQGAGASLLPGGPQGSGAQGASRSLAQGERQLAQALDGMGTGAGGSGADALAREARQIADALERSGLDPGTIVRQQRLYHRLLDAGHTLEQDEVDSSAKRVAQAAGRELFTPTTTVAQGAPAQRFPDPTWSDLRPLAADDRQIVLDYFKRINAPMTDTGETVRVR